MSSRGHKSKGERNILFVVFHKLSFVNANSMPLSAVRKEAHFFFLSLSLNSDCFPVEPKKSIAAQNACTDRRIHCVAC